MSAAHLPHRDAGAAHRIRSSSTAPAPQASFLRGGSLWRSRMNSPPNAHMLSTCFWIVFWRQIRRRQMFEERAEERDQLLTGRQIFFQSHPRSRPAVQIPAVMFQSMVDCWRRVLPLVVLVFPIFHSHAAAHHDSKSLSSLPGICLSTGPLQRRSQEHRNRCPSS